MMFCCRYVFLASNFCTSPNLSFLTFCVSHFLISSLISLLFLFSVFHILFLLLSSIFRFPVSICVLLSLFFLLFLPADHFSFPSVYIGNESVLMKLIWFSLMMLLSLLLMLFLVHILGFLLFVCTLDFLILVGSCMSCSVRLLYWCHGVVIVELSFPQSLLHNYV